MASAGTGSPLESRVGIALRTLSVLEGHLDREALKALKLHLLKALKLKSDVSAADAALLSAFERFAADRDIDGLVAHAESFVQAIIAGERSSSDINAHFPFRLVLPFCLPEADIGGQYIRAELTAASPTRTAVVGDGSHARVVGPFSRARSLDFGGAGEVRGVMSAVVGRGLSQARVTNRRSPYIARRPSPLRPTCL